MKKFVFVVTMLGLSGGVFAVLNGRAANAATPPSVASVKGSFILDERGNVGSQQTLAGLASVSFDGNGNVTGTEMLEMQGLSVTTQITGTYTLNADGSGTMQFFHTYNTGNSDNPTATITANYGFFLATNGDLRAIRTDTGFTVTATVAKQ